jgi:GPH family glycoside/pentoside/hexuronide:cation symporter
VGEVADGHSGQPVRMTFWRTVFYSLGNAAGLLTYWTFNTFVQFFYTDVKGVPPEWVGIGWFAFGFWNAVNDPIAGWLSDRTNTRWGRRRFYIGVLAIPTSIAFALVWLPPFAEGDSIALLVYFLVIISIYDMLQSIVTLNQDALFPELYQETEDRAGGSSARQLIGFVVGTGLAVVLTPTIYGRFGWDALAVIWGILAAVMYFASLLGIQENPAFVDQETVPWREQIRIVFTNRTFLIVIGVNFMMRFILAALLAVLPFYATYVLRIEEEQLTPLLAALLVTSGLSVVFWQYVVRRLGTRGTMIASMSVAAVFAFPLLFITDAVAAGAVLGLLGTAIGGIILGPDLLFAEVIDEDYADTGQRREGMYRGILGFIFRFPPAVVGLILGIGLALAGYDAGAGASVQITFTDRVTVAGDWAALTCASSDTRYTIGDDTLAVKGGPSTYTLTPETNMPTGDTCTLTIKHDLVSGTDGPIRVTEAKPADATIGTAANGDFEITLPDVDTQPSAVSTIIRVFLGVLPLIGLALGVWLLFAYPLHGEHLRTVQGRVVTLRRSGEKPKAHHPESESTD